VLRYRVGNGSLEGERGGDEGYGEDREGGDDCGFCRFSPVRNKFSPSVGVSIFRVSPRITSRRLINLTFFS